MGFALTTVGARGEARRAVESGIALAQAIGSPGVERHGRMILLCWAATFGSDPAVDGALTETRATAGRGASLEAGCRTTERRWVFSSTGAWSGYDRSTVRAMRELF